MFTRLPVAIFVFAALLVGQSGGTVEVVARDASGAAVANATVVLALAAGGGEQVRRTDADGRARFGNLAWQRFRITVAAMNFEASEVVTSVRSNVPELLEVVLRVAGASESLVVMDRADRTAVDPEQTGSRTLITREAIEQLAKSGGSRGIEQVLATFPGFAQNANGAIHPRGAHNQMTFVVDGMPISDQLGGAFANAIDPSLVETLELYTGNIPAEYGNKVSAVAQITTRSGAGMGRKFGGNLSGQAGQFDSLSQSVQMAGEAGKLAWTATVLGVKSNRYLDSVSLDNLHNGGNSQRYFGRLDYQLSGRDTLRMFAMGGRASFESANLRSQHVIDGSSTTEVNASWRPSRAELLPSEGDTPVTAWQDRRGGTMNFNGRYSKVSGRHQLRMGADYQGYPLRERFRFAVTQAGFDEELTAFTLPLGGRYFEFDERGRGSMKSAFVQDHVRLGRLTVTVGLRYDSYRFLAQGGQWQPRVGVAYHLKETGTVLRAAYNRLYQTPPNENLLLSSSPAAAALAPAIVRQTFGTAAVTLQPEKQNFYEVGLQQSLGRVGQLSGSYYHKSASDQQDNNNFFNTGIIFPITLASIRVNGAEGRFEMRPRGGWTGNVTVTHARAISTPPFTGGLFIGNEAVEALSAGPFVIDHDQKLGVSAMLGYRAKRGWFANVTSRYDSGLVANPSDPQEVAADPDYADLLPYVNLTGSPARVRPRTITDVVAGYRHSVADRARWEAAFQVTNLTDQTALYNFQSVFVGTRVVQPRTLAVRWRVWF
jgi:outer membrane cobalamin receptor